MMIRDQLSKIEAKLQAFVEGSVSKLILSQNNVSDLAVHLVKAMHSGLEQSDDGIALAPNMYLIKLAPIEAEFFNREPGLIDQLTKALEDAGREAGIVFSGKVVIKVEPSIHSQNKAVLVEAHRSSVDLPTTSALEIPISDMFADQQVPAFLIVDGTRVFSLDKPVLNIGRRSDNDLIIEDQRVSRLHAQLRWIRGQYILFDLESVGGTFVNNMQIKQLALRSGDVISLAGVPLVFGLDDIGLDKTQELNLQD